MKLGLRLLIVCFVTAISGSLIAQNDLFDNLIGMYSFDHDDDFLETDLSKNLNELTYLGDPPTEEDDRDWEAGKSVAFGGNTSVESDVLSVSELEDFSLSMWWMYFDSGAQDNPVVEIGGDNLKIGVYFTQHNGDQYYTLNVFDANNNIIDTKQVTISMGFYERLSLVRSAGDIVLYNGNEEILNMENVSTKISNPKLRIARDHSGKVAKGYTCYDDCFLYSRALSEEEVVSLGDVYADEVLLSSTYSGEEEISAMAYPNPSLGIFNLGVERVYEVYNLRGKLVTKGINNQIDLSDYSAGQYMLLFPKEKTRQTVIKK